MKYPTRGAGRFGLAIAIACLALLPSACKKKATAKQCSEMLDRFAELVVKERNPDAGADVIAAEKARERGEAKADEAFKNCPSEVQADELNCAMNASTSDAMLKCLE